MAGEAVAHVVYPLLADAASFVSEKILPARDPIHLFQKSSKMGTALFLCTKSECRSQLICVRKSRYQLRLQTFRQ